MEHNIRCSAGTIKEETSQGLFFVYVHRNKYTTAIFAVHIEMSWTAGHSTSQNGPFRS
ncbi:hypothetical protein D3C81_713230 [compost metagenome]